MNQNYFEPNPSYFGFDQPSPNPIDPSPLQEMSIQDLEAQKQHDDESLFDEDVPEDNVKIYSNPLFKFDDEYISSDVNPLFEEEPSYNQNYGDNYYPQNSPSFPQQYFCYENCEGPHESFQCQPMNQNYFEPNPSYFGFDQPSQNPIDPSPLQEMSIQDLEAQKQHMGNEDLNTILEKESDEFIKSSVEDFVLILSVSEDTDDESLFDEDVLEDNVKIYSNPFFKFDDEYISSDVNPLFEEVLENIENKDSYDFNLDEPALLVTPLFDSNEDECFDSGGDIDEIDTSLDNDISTDIEDGYHDSEGDVLYLERLLSDDTTPNFPPEVFLDHDPRSLSDINDLEIMVKVFDPRISEKIFSPTYVSLPFKDRHHLFLTYVIRIFFPYFIYPVDSPFLLFSGSEDTIFDLGISAFIFLLLNWWHLIGVELSCASMFIQTS
nr:hypothetical protein [Tanacetum cinerariifolium]